MSVKDAVETALIGWYKPKSTRITLEDFGAPTLWIDMKSSESVTFGEMEDLSDATASIEGKKQVEEIMKRVAGFITDWNIVDPRTGVPLPVPTEDDFSSLRRIPVEIVTYCQGKVQGTAVPPQK